MSDTTQPGEHRFAVEFRKTRYDGYRSYSYLGDQDCEPFVLAPELGRVPLYDLGLDEGQVAPDSEEKNRLQCRAGTASAAVDLIFKLRGQTPLPNRDQRRRTGASALNWV